MIQQPESTVGKVWLPRIDAEIPVNVYINGKQVPPIEANGRIVKFSSTSIQIRCENKIPIPSRGMVRFTFGENRDEVALNVDFVQRLEIHKSWLWKNRTEFEMRAAIQGNQPDSEQMYKTYFNQMLFGNVKNNGKKITAE